MSSGLMGCLESARPYGRQWDEEQLLFKVYRAGTAAARVREKGTKETGARS